MEQLFQLFFSLYKGQPQYGDWVVACLDGAWPRIVGERLAKVCRPARYRDAQLEVEVQDAAWADALQSLTPQIVERLQAFTGGEVVAVSLRLKTP